MKKRFYNILSASGNKIGHCYVDENGGRMILPEIISGSLKLKLDCAGESCNCGQEEDERFHTVFLK